MTNSDAERTNLARRWSLIPFVTAGLAMWTLSCGSTRDVKPPRNPAEAPPGSIGRPCKPLERAAGGPPVAFLVQVAGITTPVQEPLGPWLAGHAVEVHRLTGVLVEKGAPASGPWGVCLNASCTENRVDKLTIVASDVPADPSGPVFLEVEITSAERPTARTTLRVRNQQPALLQLPGQEGQSFVLTPYYLFDPKQESLRLYMRCLETHRYDANGGAHRLR